MTHEEWLDNAFSEAGRKMMENKIDALLQEFSALSSPVQLELDFSDPNEGRE
jgi:hypothetical protein